MGQLLSLCTRNKHSSKNYHIELYDEDDNLIKTFDNVKVAHRLETWSYAYINYVPSENECMILKTHELPARLRGFHISRKCSCLSILFCQTANPGNPDSHEYIVQDQCYVGPSKNAVYTYFDGDMIIKCGYIGEVKANRVLIMEV